MRLHTKRGYPLYEAVSAMQKAIRRNDPRIAGYFAIEIVEGGFTEYAWRRLLTISAEDCAGLITTEIWNLYESWRLIDKHKKGGGRIFVAKAVLLLCAVAKSRDADHLTNLVADARAGLQDDAEIERALQDAREAMIPVPEYAYDVHTTRGKRKGLTKRDFFLREQAALQPRREPGMFDGDLEALRAGELVLTPQE
jgi:replication-associated recombination protein RarA